MKISKYTIILLLTTLTAFSQIKIRSVESFTVEDGLSQNSVHKIFQDNRGLLWIGTESGVNKFDGYDILPYHLFDQQSLFSVQGTVYDIAEDSHGNIWYGSMESLYRISTNSEITENLQKLISDSLPTKFLSLRTVSVDNSGNIWFGTFGKGLFKVAHDFSTAINFRNDPDSTGDSSLDYIQDIIIDNTGNLWLATYSGLVKFDPTTETFENIFHKSPNDNLKHETINKLIISKNILFIASNRKGLIKFDLTNEKVKPLPNEINDQLINYNIRDITVDKQGRIWAAAQNAGIFVYDMKKQSLTPVNDFLPINNFEELKKPLSILIDKSGIVWIGTQYAGLFKVILGEKYFTNINNSQKGFETIESNVISSIAKDESNDNLWIATASGLYVVNLKTNNIKELEISKLIKSGNYRFLNILFANGYAWISYANNIYKHHLNSDSYNQVDINIPSSILELNQVDNDKIFIGTNNNFGYIYDLNFGLTDSLIIKNSEERVPIIESYFDSENSLWLGTYKNLYKVNLLSDSLSAEEIELPVQIEYITSIQKLGNTIWFGTYGAGLLSYNEHSKQSKHYTLKDGLPNNVIYGVLTDRTNHLWISTNKGISQFNIQNNSFKNFTLADGIQGHEFNSKAYYKSTDGEIFYGGLNGVSYFTPKKINVNLTAPKTIITRVSLFDSTIVTNVAEERNSPFEFSSSENSFSFEYSSLDYTDPSKNKYLYKMEGIHQNWINADDKRYATFANMSPGQYRFIVRGSNNDQVFDSLGALFSFVIYPPFYATWWFRVLIVLTIILTFYSVYKFRMLNQEKRLRDIEGIRRHIADDFHDDLGHKLTRITLYSEMLKNKEEFGKEEKAYLDKIGEASNSLFYETKDFIWSIDPGQDTVYDVLIYIKDFGDDFFSRTTISFKVDEINEQFKKYSLPMKMKREIVLIFKEAMNNALKHSGADTSELTACIDGNILIIKLTDDGHGFDINKTDSTGRGLQSMKKRAAVISGRVEVETDKKSTSVVFTINLSEVENDIRKFG